MKLKEPIDTCLRELQYVPVPAKNYNLAKVKGNSATYRIRIQRIRIIYDVYWDTKQIDVLSIEKKKDSTYKRFR